MFAKLAALILSVGIVACVLLGIRQMRIQAAAETAMVQRRVAEHDRTLWRLRLEIASRITPAEIERKALAYGLLKPINPDRYQELVRAEAKAAGTGGESTVTLNSVITPSP